MTGYTHISVILDRSGSMSTIQDDVIDGFNAFLREQQQLAGSFWSGGGAGGADALLSPGGYGSVGQPVPGRLSAELLTSQPPPPPPCVVGGAALCPRVRV